MPRLRTVALLITLTLVPLLSLPVVGQDDPLAGLEPVGSTRLKWMLWNIYDSTLYTASGSFEGIEPGLALQLNYRRNIEAARLVDTTRDQWREMGIYRGDQSEDWLTLLNGLWPDIRRGDSLTLRVEPELTAGFYHNGQILGRLADAQFTRDFLAIWLGEQTLYPKQRDELIDANQ